MTTTRRIAALHATAGLTGRSFLLSLALVTPALARVLAAAAPADTTHEYENPAGASPLAPRTPFFQKKLVRALLMPTALIDYRACTL